MTLAGIYSTLILWQIEVSDELAAADKRRKIAEDYENKRKIQEILHNRSAMDPKASVFRFNVQKLSYLAVCIKILVQMSVVHQEEQERVKQLAS